MTARQDGFSNHAPVTLVERERDLMLEDTKTDVALTPDQARYIARKLYRLARRIEQREQQPA